MGGVRHVKELNDIVVYNGLCAFGPLQTERKLSSCSRIVYCKHTLLQTVVLESCSYHMAVSSGYTGAVSLCPDGGTYQCTSTSLLALMAFNRGESEQRDDALSRLVPACPWAEEGARDLNFGVHQGVHQASSADKAFKTPGMHTALKCSRKT